VTYTYKVTSDKVEWLNIIYDDELIMRYKLNIMKDLPQADIMKVTAAVKYKGSKNIPVSK
jgi:hypothetical protein